MLYNALSQNPTAVYNFENKNIMPKKTNISLLIKKLNKPIFVQACGFEKIIDQPDIGIQLSSLCSVSEDGTFNHYVIAAHAIND